MIEKITILGGLNKNRNSEPVKRLVVSKGEILSIVGLTGSGKSQLISDVGQWAAGETPSKRSVLINDLLALEYAKQSALRHMVAEVSQNMNFVIDMSVSDFLHLHAQSRELQKADAVVNEVIRCANHLTGEPIKAGDNLTTLSGGQSRSLMVADVALISNAPVVLIDEIENAGINRLEALKFLAVQGKVVLVVTHDPVLALMADRRVIMKKGGISKLITTTEEEKKVLEELVTIDQLLFSLREELREGQEIKQIIMKEVKQYYVESVLT